MKLKRLLQILPWILCDTFLMAVSGLLSVWVCTGTASVAEFYKDLMNFFSFMPFHLVLTIIIFYFFNMYAGIWRFFSTLDAFYCVMAVFLSSGVYAASTLWLIRALRQPFPIYVTFFIVFAIFVVLSRSIFRVGATFSRIFSRKKKTTHNVMVIGAGQGGHMIAYEMASSPKYANSKIACFIDDDPNKHRLYIGGVQVVGGREMIAPMVKKHNVEEIIFAIPSCGKTARQEILSICAATKCRVHTLPTVQELSPDASQPLIKEIRNVEIEDLLGREPIRTDLHDIMQMVTEKCVLVTGAGGSIGSELCRQIAAYRPKCLVLFDIYENSLYECQLDLLSKYPDLNVAAIIGSMCDETMVNDLFAKFKPQIVYHAAAHKHVPLMEDAPCECVNNNVFGTLNLVKAADAHGVKRFVLISTDKAVNPTNVMGTTKRICEMIVQLHNARSATEFVAVRFGNVLGSNGSVIPIFKKQIARGGPVTITDKKIIRYFMTIPEAVSLVLQAGALAKGGEIFVLDMGDPVKILDLAENLIRLSGFVPYEEIDIVETGLRPGEKLYEELLMDEEGLKSTENKLIYIGHPLQLDEEKLTEQLETLRQVALQQGDVIGLLQEIVPTYHPKK